MFPLFENILFFVWINKILKRKKGMAMSFRSLQLNRGLNTAQTTDREKDEKS